MPKDTEGPPCTRCAENSQPVVDHHMRVIPNTEHVHGSGKGFLRGKHVLHQVEHTRASETL